MKNKIAITILLFTSLGAFAQVTKDDLDKEIKPLFEKVKTLQSESSKMKSEIGILNAKLKSANDSIDNLKQKVDKNTNDISKTANELGIQIKETGDKNAGKITEVSESLSKKFALRNYRSAFSNTSFRTFILAIEQKTTNRQNRFY